MALKLYVHSSHLLSKAESCLQPQCRLAVNRSIRSQRLYSRSSMRPSTYVPLLAPEQHCLENGWIPS